MINLIDSTLKESKEIDPDSLISLIKNESVKGVNWWNTFEFPEYLRKMHINPWLLLDNIDNNLKDKKIIIDLRVNQLSSYQPYSAEKVNKFLSSLPINDNLFIKIYDPLNNIANIQNTIQIALKNNVQIIGGIFLRPDKKDFPNCHTDLIKLYKSNGISNISLIEPLGLLKQNNLNQIIKLIQKSFQTVEIKLSIKHIVLQQPMLLSEAIINGVSEIDYSLITAKCGLPSLEIIQEVLNFLDMNGSSKDVPVKLMNKSTSLDHDINNSNTEDHELMLLKLDFPNIPINSIYSIKNLKYFTNVPFDLKTILNEITKTQIELGNPPFIEPFSSIITSQAIFRLQNSSKSLQTLETLKYIAGYWGEVKEDLSGDFKDFIPLAESLKKKSKTFNFATLDPIEISNLQKVPKSSMRTEKESLLFEFSPEEANYFFNEYSNLPDLFDISDRKNLAMLVKAFVEHNHITTNNFSLNLKSANNPQTNMNSNEFRWRYLSRLFQMGKF